MPERFLLQILRNLVTHGILESTRGVEGGYTLLRRPDYISVLEVIQAIDRPLGSEVPVSEGLNSESQERLQLALRQVTRTARQQLESIKLSQIVRPEPSEVA